MTLESSKSGTSGNSAAFRLSPWKAGMSFKDFRYLERIENWIFGIEDYFDGVGSAAHVGGFPE